MEAKENNMCYGVPMDREIWRPVNIEEYRNTHEVSNFGRVRSLPRVVSTGKGTRNMRGKILTPTSQGQIRMSNEQGSRTYRLINVIGYTFIDGYHEYLNVTYKDNKPSNASLDNIIVHTVRHYKELQYLTVYPSYIDNIPIIAGGFTKDSRILVDITIANKLNREVYNLRKLTILPNLHRFKEGEHYIDLKEYRNFKEFVPMLLDLGYTEIGLINSDHIYIFSELGVSMLMSCIENTNDTKWEFLDTFTRKYFQMEEKLKEVNTPQLTEKQMCILALYEGGAEAVTAAKRLSEIEVQEATQPLIEAKEKVEQEKANLVHSPKTYTATSIAKELGFKSAQLFNKQLALKGIQFKQNNIWVLKSQYADKGYMDIKQFTIKTTDEDGNIIEKVLYDSRWTGKGRDWLINEVFKDKQHKLWPVNV